MNFVTLNSRALVRVFLEFATVVYDAGMISAAQISVEPKFEWFRLSKCTILSHGSRTASCINIYLR